MTGLVRLNEGMSVCHSPAKWAACGAGGMRMQAETHISCNIATGSPSGPEQGRQTAFLRRSKHRPKRWPCIDTCKMPERRVENRSVLVVGCCQASRLESD